MPVEVFRDRVYRFPAASVGSVPQYTPFRSHRLLARRRGAVRLDHGDRGRLVMAVAGVVTWVVIGNTLSDQKITVSQDADCLAGDDVNGPFSAYCQAMVINKHTMGITGGQTYSELAKDDPNRATAMDSAFLQASLFTSVVAFGVALMAFVVGVVLTLIGLAIRSPVDVATRGEPLGSA